MFPTAAAPVCTCSSCAFRGPPGASDAAKATVTYSLAVDKQNLRPHPDQLSQILHF